MATTKGKYVFASSSIIDELTKSGVLPDNCRSATIHIDYLNVCTVTWECLATKDVLTAVAKGAAKDGK